MKLGLVMIVRDEMEQIDRCLASAQAAGVTVATIVDTGSTDGTYHALRPSLRPWVRRFRKPWVNFGVNRSHAFLRAQGSADWLLALDADMTVEWDEGWEPDPAVDAYTIGMAEGEFTWRLPLLLRGDIAWKSVGACHEYTARADGRPYTALPTDHVRVTYEARPSPEKTAWQAGLLEAELAGDPGNARTMFYLAQCYRELGRRDDARQMYIHCAMTDTFAEEAWYAQYQAALLAPTYETRLADLIRAWEKRPHRLEPVYAMAREANSLDHHWLAWALTEAVWPVTPTADTLFVHGSVWNWGIAFERSIAAYWTGRKDLCRELSLDLLTRPIPDDIRAAVIANLAFCT